MSNIPKAVRLTDLVAIEKNVVEKSIWILDSVESSFEISSGDFLEVMLHNLSRGIDYKWILPDGVVAQDVVLQTELEFLPH